MPLSTDQQANVDMQIAVQTAMEQVRHQNLMAIESKRAEMEKQRVKMETIRIAKDMLVENSRSKPVDAREVNAADIVAFAAMLEAHINA